MKEILKKIKPVLKKEYYIREITLLVVITLSLLCFGIYESLAIFQTNIEKSSVATIKAGDIYFTLTSTNSAYNSSTKQITVAANTTVELPLTITNNTIISSKYKLYYKAINPTTLPEGVTVSVKSKIEEGYDEGIIETNASIEKTIIIENTSSSSITIEIGVEKGYSHNELALSSGNTQLELFLIPPPNEPVLAEGMIPVVYNDTDDVWVIANTEEEWYDYDEQIWANAVTTSVASYRTAQAGTPIPMDDINTMWVWIPRFKYKIPSNIGSSTSVTEPPEIDVVFESGTNATGVSETVYRNGMTSVNTNYYTHPAFRNIDNIEYDSSTQSRGAWDEEITGFWVGKFETSIDENITSDNSSKCYSSKSSTNCNTSNLTPIIKPDVVSLAYQNVSNQFLTSLKFGNGIMDTTTGEVTFDINENNIYGLNTTTNTTDTHMMKNTEWGAVAILSQSQYGKMGNEDYTGKNKEVYSNDSYNYQDNYKAYTGRSSGVPSTGDYTKYGTYSYNDKKCSTSNFICSGSKVVNKGTGASTTGTIYGIYDMSGGSEEYTMGNWANYSGYSSGNSGFAGLAGKDDTQSSGISFPENKYYDLYMGTSSSIIMNQKSKVILGDTIFEANLWYGSNNQSVYKGNPWFSRGGISYSSSSSVFYAFYGGGNPSYQISFHTTLIP